jgi:hypothetical protein
VSSVIAYLATHLKVAFWLEGYPWWKTLHITTARMKFYDQQLNPNVGWARHALAIDEHRADFDRVPWGSMDECRVTAPDEPDWLQQLWFAGDHSDVGGNIENEFVSDITLEWMTEAQMVAESLKIDRSILHLSPTECNTTSGEVSYSALLERLIVQFHDAKLHPSVMTFKLPRFCNTI